VSLVSPTVRRWIDDGLRDPEGLWERAARELPWFRPCSRAFVWDPPTFRWFVGAETNLAYNAVDRHVPAGQSGRAALAYINERGERRVHMNNAWAVVNDPDREERIALLPLPRLPMF